MAYQAKETEVKKLLVKLEKQQTGAPSNKSFFRKEVIIPITLTFGLVVVFLTIFTSTRRKKAKE